MLFWLILFLLLFPTVLKLLLTLIEYLATAVILLAFLVMELAQWLRLKLKQN